MDLAGVTCQADRSDVVSEADRAAKLYEGNVIVEQGVVVVGMYDDLGHGAAHFMDVRAPLSLSSKVESPCTG